MSEMNAADMIETMRDAGHISPHPPGRITQKIIGVIAKSGPFRREKFLLVWRLQTGLNKDDFRDYDSKLEAEAARVLMGL